MEFIIRIIFWTLAIYGLFEIIKNIIYISTYTNFKSDGIYVIIAVKNQEDKIEGFMRSALFKMLYGRDDYVKNIIITDIKKKLSEEYECLEAVNWKECKEIMDSVDES